MFRSEQVSRKHTHNCTYIVRSAPVVRASRAVYLAIQGIDLDASAIESHVKYNRTKDEGSCKDSRDHREDKNWLHPHCLPSVAAFLLHRRSRRR